MLPRAVLNDPPERFHRGRTVGSVSGAIAAAGLRMDPPRKFKYPVLRDIRLALAAAMVKVVDSYSDLSDRELWSLARTCTLSVDAIAGWLVFQDYDYIELEDEDEWDS